MLIASICFFIVYNVLHYTFHGVDIIKELLSKDMHVEAVHLACAFGLEEKFPPIPLLSSVLQKSLQTAKEEQREGQSLVCSIFLLFLQDKINFHLNL